MGALLGLGLGWTVCDRANALRHVRWTAAAPHLYVSRSACTLAPLMWQSLRAARCRAWARRRPRWPLAGAANPRGPRCRRSSCARSSVLPGAGAGVVMIAHDTRPSAGALVAAAAAGVAALGGAAEHCGLLTTPQLHWMVRQRNAGAEDSEAAYFGALAAGFAALAGRAAAAPQVRGPRAALGWLQGPRASASRVGPCDCLVAARGQARPASRVRGPCRRQQR